MAKPTESATVIRSQKASIRPLEMSAALSAMAISAGSATVVEKPMVKAKSKSQKTEPFLAKSTARPSPMGKIPSSSPRIKSASPIATIVKPITIEVRFSGTA